MSHPYKQAPRRAFWARSCVGQIDLDLPRPPEPLIRQGDKVISAGSCFAANIVPYLEAAGLTYLRVEQPPNGFAALAEDNFSYGKFSAAYGNLYTARQALQLVQRALGRFVPVERCWVLGEDLVIDPFRPGLRYPAQTVREHELLTAQHLAAVLKALRGADVFVFTLGLTEAWLSKDDGAVFPACPGTIAGEFDPTRHVFHNFTVAEVVADLDGLIATVREINPAMRFVFTVSPVPLVATATPGHVAVATSYSKSVLRVAADEAARRHSGVTYFPSYEIVTGPQAPADFFESDRRSPSKRAIAAVMRAFLAQCQSERPVALEDAPAAEVALNVAAADRDPSLPASDVTARRRVDATSLSQLIVDADCEEAAAGKWGDELSQPADG